MSPSPFFLSLFVDDYDRTEPLRGAFGDDDLAALDARKATRKLSPEERAHQAKEAQAQALRIRRRRALEALTRGDEAKLLSALAGEVDLSLDVYGTTALRWLLENFETCADPLMLESVLAMGAKLNKKDKRGNTAQDFLTYNTDLREVVQVLLLRNNRKKAARQLGPLPQPEPSNDNDLRAGRAAVLELLGVRC